MNFEEFFFITGRIDNCPNVIINKKAVALKEVSADLIKRFNGEVPRTYDELISAAPKPDWRKQLEETHALIRARYGEREIEPAPEEIIRQGRENRDEQLLDNLR